MSEPIILGIDHGYAAMKTAHCCFPTGLVEYAHEPYSMENVLEYEGRYFVVGSGRQPLQKDKTQSEDYYLLTLAAIAQDATYKYQMDVATWEENYGEKTPPKATFEERLRIYQREADQQHTQRNYHSRDKGAR